MAVPKRKTSNAKRNSRRANWKATAPTLVECPSCHQKKPSHVACPHCGHYQGRNVIETN